MIECSFTDGVKCGLFLETGMSILHESLVSGECQLLIGSCFDLHQRSAVMEVGRHGGWHSKLSVMMSVWHEKVFLFGCLLM